VVVMGRCRGGHNGMVVSLYITERLDERLTETIDGAGKLVYHHCTVPGGLGLCLAVVGCRTVISCHALPCPVGLPRTVPTTRQR
jgi:hypothetical protein